MKPLLPALLPTAAEPSVKLEVLFHAVIPVSLVAPSLSSSNVSNHISWSTTVVVPVPPPMVALTMPSLGSVQSSTF